MLDVAIGLKSFSPKMVSMARLVELCASDHIDGGTYICRTTMGGSANLNLFNAAPGHADACRAVTQYLGRSSSHSWPEEYAILCNFPCYLVTDNGAIITRDGKVIQESLYPSAGDQTPSRLLGVKLPSESLEDLLARASPVLTDKVCTSFFSRWARVYFHALSECLVQDGIFERIGLKPHLQYLSVENINQVQRRFVEFSSPSIQWVEHDVVDVPRTLFSTVARRHAVLGMDFRQAIEGVRLKAAEINSKPVTPAERFYVSRQGEAMRPLINESEIAAIFESEGFKIVKPQSLSLIEQANLFSNASVVVGPHGAGLANSAFARSNTIIFEMRGLNRMGGSPDMNETYRKISAIMGLRYGFHIVANEAESDSWSIPVDAAMGIAKSLKSAPPK